MVNFLDVCGPPMHPPSQNRQSRNFIFGSGFSRNFITLFIPSMIATWSSFRMPLRCAVCARPPESGYTFV